MSTVSKGDPSDEYILPDSNSRYMDVNDINGMSKEELRLARNEIYARHGRIFSSSDLNDYFNSMAWYVGCVSAEEFDDSVLNEYEKSNLDLIKSIEGTK
uniref:YARHG domain-containing protein n=1 Tax=Clostridium sp. NkU-1 TaxID=1095009 RepID=UPI0006D05231